MRNMQYKRPSTSVGSVVVRAVLVLLVLLMLSVHLMSGLLAKYGSSGQSGDSARVAKFEVNVSGSPKTSEIKCTAVASGSGTYTITIENKSEVAVHYELSVVLTGDTAGVTYEFSPARGNLAVGETGTSTLTFTVNWNDFTAGKTGSSATGTLSFTVTVDVTQID